MIDLDIYKLELPDNRKPLDVWGIIETLADLTDRYVSGKANKGVYEDLGRLFVFSCVRCKGKINDAAYECEYGLECQHPVEMLIDIVRMHKTFCDFRRDNQKMYVKKIFGIVGEYCSVVTSDVIFPQRNRIEEEVKVIDFEEEYDN